MSLYNQAKYVFITALLLASFVGDSYGQTKIKEGLIKMEISDVESDDPMIASQMEMIEGTETDYFFSEKKSLVVVNLMGGMVKMQSLTDNISEETTLLMDMMGQKTLVNSTKEERKAMEDSSETSDANMTVRYVDSDTKEILGFNCIKAIISSDSSTNPPFEMYITEDLEISSKLIKNLQDIDLKGFPLEYTMNMDKMSMTYSVVEIVKELDQNVFELDSTGYEKMSFDEFLEQSKALGGGMGF